MTRRCCQSCHNSRRYLFIKIIPKRIIIVLVRSHNLLLSSSTSFGKFCPWCYCCCCGSSYQHREAAEEALHGAQSTLSPSLALQLVCIDGHGILSISISKTLTLLLLKRLPVLYRHDDFISTTDDDTFFPQRLLFSVLFLFLERDHNCNSTAQKYKFQRETHSTKNTENADIEVGPASMLFFLIFPVHEQFRILSKKQKVAAGPPVHHHKQKQRGKKSPWRPRNLQSFFLVYFSPPTSTLPCPSSSFHTSSTTTLLPTIIILLCFNYHNIIINYLINRRHLYFFNGNASQTNCTTPINNTTRRIHVY